MEKEVHEFVSGQPRKGKSYYVQEKIRRLGLPVLYISTKKESFDGFILADEKSPLELILKALMNNGKVFYKVDYRRDFMLTEISLLVKMLFGIKSKGKKVLVVFDECHNYAYEGQKDSPIFRVAQEGLYEIKSIFISQFPSAVPKRILRSCELHTFFSMTNYEEKYYKMYGVPTETVKAGLINRYDYVQLLNGEVMQ